VTGRAALGYIRKNAAAGRWILRRYIDGKYRVIPLGAADDVIDADGDQVLSFAQAEARARTLLKRPTAGTGRRQHIIDKFEQIAAGQWTLDVLARQRKHLHEADWRTQIYNIEVEPFASRDEKKLLASMRACGCRSLPTRENQAGVALEATNRVPWKDRWSQMMPWPD
jgi:hypothetical protein